jgi:hypothetical protein
MALERRRDPVEEGDGTAGLPERVGRLEGTVERMISELGDMRDDIRSLRGLLWALVVTTLVGPFAAYVLSRLLV